MKQLLLAFTILLSGCGSSLDNDLAIVQVKFGDTKLRIPQRYLLPNFPTSIVPANKDLDEDVGVTLKIPLTDLGLVIEQQDGLEDEILVYLAKNDNSNSQSYLNASAIDAWKSVGLYKEKIIELDELLNLYRIYPKAGYPVIWQYFISTPEENKSPEVTWVASCIASPIKEEKTNSSKTTCQTNVIYRDVRSEISLSLNNMFRLNDISARYLELLNEWASVTR